MATFKAVYHGPTNTRGSRISVTSAHGRMVIPYDHSAHDPYDAAIASYCAAKRIGPYDLVRGPANVDTSGAWIYVNKDNVGVSIGEPSPDPKSLRPAREPAFVLHVSTWRKGRIAIRVWDGSRGSHGGERLDVEVSHKGEIVFAFGQLCCGLPACGGVTTDGIEARELVLSLVGMRPGDTDRDYFDGYTPEQLAWVREHADLIDQARMMLIDPRNPCGDATFTSMAAAKAYWRRERVRMTRDDKLGYHRFKNDDGEPYGSFEVFYVARADKFTDVEGNALHTGYYWYACFPGCMPDGEPSGPFKTSQLAHKAAMEGGS